MKSSRSLLLLFLLSGCAKKSLFEEHQWFHTTSQHGPPLITQQFSAPENIRPSEAKAIRAGSAEIQFQEVFLAGIPLKSSFIKTVWRNSQPIFISSRVPSEALSLDLDRLKTMERDVLTIQFFLKKYDPLLKVEKARIVWLPSLSGIHLSFEVTALNADGEFVEFLIDPDHQVLSKRRLDSGFEPAALNSTTSSSQVFARIFPLGPKYSQLQNIALSGLVGDGTLNSRRAKVTTLSAEKVQIAGDQIQYDPDSEKFDQVQVYHFVSQTLDSIEKQYGVEIPFQLDVQLHVGSPQKTNTAFYYGGHIRLGRGDEELYRKIPQDPSIVYHETYHAMIEVLAKLPNEGEGGALNEAFADFFTALQLDSPLLAESSYLKAAYKRTLNETHLLSEKTGQKYHDSLIVSSLLWECRKILGREMAGQISLKTLSLLTPISDFRDFIEKFKQVSPEFASAQQTRDLQALLQRRGW